MAGFVRNAEIRLSMTKRAIAQFYEIAKFCREQPRECFELILAALKSATTSDHIIGIGGPKPGRDSCP